MDTQSNDNTTSGDVNQEVPVVEAEPIDEVSGFDLKKRYVVIMQIGVSELPEGAELSPDPPQVRIAPMPAQIVGSGEEILSLFKSKILPDAVKFNKMANGEAAIRKATPGLILPGSRSSLPPGILGPGGTIRHIHR